MSDAAAWVVAVLNNRDDAVNVIAERLEAKQVPVAALEERVKEMHRDMNTMKKEYEKRITELEAQLASRKRVDGWIEWHGFRNDEKSEEIAGEFEWE